MAEEKAKDIHPHAENSGDSPNGSTFPSGNGHAPNGHPWNAPSGTYVYQQSGSTVETEKPPPEPQAAHEEHPQPKRRKWLWIVLLALALAAALFIYRYFAAASAAKTENAAKAREEAAASITVAQAKTGDINIYIDALGTVTPVYTVTLYSQITGRVLDVHYKEGQMVKKGDPLIDIDPRPYQSTLTQAEGNLQHDEAVLAQAQMDLKRYQAAYERNAISRQQLDDQTQAVVQYQGSVKADQGTVEYDEVELSYCHIVSPINGRVGLRLVDPGNTVFAGSASTLVVITQLQPITVVFNVSEDDMHQIEAQLRGGRALRVDAFDRSYNNLIESGTLTSVDNQVDTTTGTVKFRAEFQNKNLLFYPNQFVNARLLVTTLHKVVLVPSGAVQHNGTNAFVYLVNSGNTVSVQQIKTLASDDQNTAVQGINAGSNVAVSGFDRLESGVRVSYPGEPGQQNAPQPNGLPQTGSQQNGSIPRSGPARQTGPAQQKSVIPTTTQPQRNNQGHGSNSSTGGSTTPP